MENTTKKQAVQYGIVLIYLLLYGFFSFLFLEEFPLVHSDESWLAGLTRNMAENLDFSVTEPFFDARTRYPHAIKILFHALQMVFLLFFGYSAETFRLLSLLAGLFVLFLFYKTAKKLFDSFFFSFGLMMLFSFDIQFIYATHFARQEILLLLSVVLCQYLLFGIKNPYTTKRAIAAAIITGLSVGLHPNSFILACMMGFCYLAILMHQHKKDLRPLLVYVSVTGAIAAIFVAISYSFDPHFLTHYFTNGAAEFGIDAAPADRLSGLFSFFERLFLRQGGTYYVADIRLQLILFAGAFLLLFCFYLAMKKEEATLCGKILVLLSAALGIIIGIFLIGRYSQLSIVFLFPIGWLLVAYALKLFEKPIQTGGLILLFAALLVIGTKEIYPHLGGMSHDLYLKQIAEYVEPDDKVLGNLNMNFYFENGALLDYRNLPYVMETEGTLENYIIENEIEYIFYTDELTYYFEHRPYYNALYGNIMFAEELLAYCEENCELVGVFGNSRYAPRILELIGQEEYGTVYVYKITNVQK